MNYSKRCIVLAMASCFAAALSWAQIPTSRADIMKEVIQRLDIVGKKLNLSPDQINKIKPLLIQQMEKTTTARAKFAASDQGAVAKQEALDTIQGSRASTRNKVKNILAPDQLKQWDDVVKEWKDDVTLQGLGKFLGK